MESISRRDLVRRQNNNKAEAQIASLERMDSDQRLETIVSVLK